MALADTFCPYVGLQPYTEQEQDYFFGRETDIQTISANLVTTPLTLLYGMSGVGKSSVLLAGVAPFLRTLPDVTVVIFREWQGQNLLSSLRTTIAETVSKQLGETFTSNEDPLDVLLERATKATQTTIALIFDQFEEYFLYHAETTHQEGFDVQFARAVNRVDIDANFLLSIREDSTSRLDRFQHRIPNIWNNSLRLGHLDREAATRAIRKPIARYNELHNRSDSPIQLEDALVDELLEKARPGHVTIGVSGEGHVSDEKMVKHVVQSNETRIETPFLQLVMTRLWAEDIQSGRTLLRLHTLNKLGGVERIVKSHLDHSMHRLSGAQRKVASRIFTYLVTPDGGKIALTASALADWAKLDQARVATVLTTLSKDQRILRSVADERYELFHDQLAPAILDWRRRYVDKQKMLKTVGGFIGIILVVATMLVVGAWIQAKDADLKAKTLALKLEQKKNEDAKREIERNRKFSEAKLLYNESNKFLASNNNYQTGLQQLDKALNIYRILKATPMIIETLIRKGEILAVNKELTKAQALYDQAGKLSAEIDDRGATGKILEKMATLKEKQGHQAEGLALLAQAQMAFQDGGEPQSSGRVSERLAMSEEKREQFGQARQAYEQAFQSYTLSGDQLGMTRTQEALERIAKLLPWGHLMDLHDGKIYPLRGDETELGRSVPEGKVQADVSFPNNFISRHHLVIRRDHSIEDLRSRNGTTINGTFLPYGVGRKLQDGDIIALAHVKTLQFRVDDPGNSFTLPTKPWAIFINNQSRSYRYLSSPVHSLVLQNQKLSIERGASKGALLHLRWSDKAEVFDAKDEWQIVFTQKETDYDYRSYPLTAEDKWIEMFSLPLQIVKLSVDKKRIKHEGPAFQLILFHAPKP